jgi:hypothetical protein
MTDSDDNYFYEEDEDYLNTLDVSHPDSPYALIQELYSNETHNFIIRIEQM